MSWKLIPCSCNSRKLTLHVVASRFSWGDRYITAKERPSTTVRQGLRSWNISSASPRIGYGNAKSRFGLTSPGSVGDNMTCESPIAEVEMGYCCFHVPHYIPSGVLCQSFFRILPTQSVTTILKHPNYEDRKVTSSK